MLTAMDDEESVFRSLGAGATGYLHKHSSQQEILAAIREVREGGSVISPGIARLVVRSFQPRVDHDLSQREAEVLTKLCDGENYRSIADMLFISSNTVKAHIKNIYVKLHVNTRAEAVRLAMRDRLV
ncbi:MAG: response regulator transcription factor [Flavobacteriales bacterium]|nr:response regulator transcription factor [Flavobacteriales bacterium]